MNMTIKSAIAACGFLVAVSVPLTAAAEAIVFSGKDAFGAMSGSSGDGNLYLDVVSFESTTQSKSNKTSSSGAYLYGSYYTGSECWYGFGFADNIQLKFDAKGSLPKQVTASGEVLVTWIEYCNAPYSEFTETVTFNGDMTAMRDQASHSWGTNHYEYGNIIKVNDNFNYSSTPAAVSASSISSPAFGTVTPSWGYVGTSKGHSVQITR